MGRDKAPTLFKAAGRKLYAGGILWFLAGVVIHAETLYVPEDYPTISEAKAAASPFDEIVVAPGDYPGFIFDKPLTIRSTYDGTDWSVVENTVIKMTRQYWSGTAVQVPPIAAGSVLRGFTITMDPLPYIPEGFDIFRLGISSDGVQADIDSCIIENCVAVTRDGGGAGPQCVESMARFKVT